MKIKLSFFKVARNKNIMRSILFLICISLLSITFSCSEDGMISCNDGIKNGNEISVDCGGDCSPCTVDAALLNVWRLTSATEDGLDAYSFYQIDDIFHEYKSDGQFCGINISKNRTNKVILDGVFELSSSGESLTILNDFTSTISLTISGNMMIQEYFLGDNHWIETYELVAENLCLDVECKVDCRYGYCFP